MNRPKVERCTVCKKNVTTHPSRVCGSCQQKSIEQKAGKK